MHGKFMGESALVNLVTSVHRRTQHPLSSPAFALRQGMAVETVPFDRTTSKGWSQPEKWPLR
jgi:hypothetical protein